MPQCAPLSEGLEERELPIVELREGDALGIAIKLLVLFFVSHEIYCVGDSRNSAANIVQLTRTCTSRSKRPRFERRDTICGHCEKLLRGSRS
jgi:hypothetical protein